MIKVTQIIKTMICILTLKSLNMKASVFKYHNNAIRFHSLNLYHKDQV